MLAAFVVIAIVGPLLWHGDANRVDVAALSEGSSGAHPLGTDALGRDVLARTLVATRLSLVLALVTAVIGFSLGLVIGVVPAIAGGRTRRWTAAVINLLNAFPGILLILLVATIAGIGERGAVLALAAALTPQVGRLTQTLASSVADIEYVAAARGLGVRWPRLVARHIVPNITPALAVQFAMTIGSALLALSALSFLGLGIQPPQYDWGALLRSGLERIYVAPAAALGPAAAIVLVSSAFNVLGDAVADAMAVREHGPTRRRRGRWRRAAPPPGVASLSVAARAGADSAVLDVEGLTVAFPSPTGEITPVRDVSFSVRPAERLGIVGESGSGKSLTALATAHLIEPPGRVISRVMALGGDELRQLPRHALQRRLGTSLAMVFQDPLGALNPALRVERQVTEGAEVHLGLAHAQASSLAAERFRELGIAGGSRRLRQYPHELSGGMRQRAVIAMGLMTKPRVILADEPTTALDVTVQRQVLRALWELNEREGTAIVLISHDISVIAAFCSRVLVMYGGRIVEELPADRLHQAAAHPYTRALLAAIPDMETDPTERLASIPGRPPRAHEIPEGCPFVTRCAYASERCGSEPPTLQPLDSAHRVACWHPQGAGVVAPDVGDAEGAR